MESIINYMSSMGFVLIPLIGKRPILKNWQNTTLEEGKQKTLSMLKGKVNNYGILTGIPSDIIVVDIDKRNGGIEIWLDLIKDHILEETFVVETGSGGYHIYYQYDPRLSLSTKIQGIDFLSNGRQVVGPGSIHPDTNQIYSVVYGYRDNTIVIATIPEFLIDLFKK